MASRRQKKAQKKGAAVRRFLTRQASLTSDQTQQSPALKPAEDLLLKEDVLKLQDFGLPFAIANKLWSNGIKTIGVLESRTEQNILDLPGIGKVSLRQIKEVLAQLGRSLSSG